MPAKLPEYETLKQLYRNHSYTEIARMFNSSKSVVSSRLRHGAKRRGEWPLPRDPSYKPPVKQPKGIPGYLELERLARHLTYPEIAELYGGSVSTIEKKIHDGRIAAGLQGITSYTPEKRAKAMIKRHKKGFVRREGIRGWLFEYVQAGARPTSGFMSLSAFGRRFQLEVTTVAGIYRGRTKTIREDIAKQLVEALEILEAEREAADAA